MVQVTKWSLDSMLMKTVCVPGPSGGWELGLPGSGSLVCRGGDGEEVTVDQTSDESEQVILVPAAVYVLGTVQSVSTHLFLIKTSNNLTRLDHY